jgi:hypothetical protein
VFSRSSVSVMVLVKNAKKTRLRTKIKSAANRKKYNFLATIKKVKEYTTPMHFLRDLLIFFLF